eukprot:TRINITY_DN7871_c0_g1_i1.p1 TRINITY_DN7871_c0_g1~~TRINITY_DN7871_c0_g1_i1.p1  ORF type:complete len:385 (-),score=64.24 TRINITY_DN7871_c0_g1_i1:68-1222(-)
MLHKPLPIKQQNLPSRSLSSHAQTKQSSNIFDFLLTAPIHKAKIESVQGWWDRHQAATKQFSVPFDVAVAGGFSSDCVAFTFASGYQAAMQYLLGDEFRNRRVALCATEGVKGAPPTSMATTLSPIASDSTQKQFKVNGAKGFVTLGKFAEVLVVVAKEEKDGESEKIDESPNKKNHVPLRLVLIDSKAPGVVIEERPKLPFIPEIEHSRVKFNEVVVGEKDVLRGDGWSRYVKPFRTIEDIHIHAATLGYLMRLAREWNWPSQVQVEELLLPLSALRTVALGGAGGGGEGKEREEGREFLSSHSVHCLIGGIFSKVKKSLESDKSSPSPTNISSLADCWSLVTDLEVREKWERDKLVLGVANAAREKREKIAWEGILKRRSLL